MSSEKRKLTEDAGGERAPKRQAAITSFFAAAKPRQPEPEKEKEREEENTPTGSLSASQQTAASSAHLDENASMTAPSWDASPTSSGSLSKSGSTVASIAQTEEEEKKREAEGTNKNKNQNNNGWDEQLLFDAFGAPTWEQILGEEWSAALKSELNQSYLKACVQKVAAARRAGPDQIFPPPSQVFTAFRTSPIDQVKVVIVGQDPYHRKGQAMGLSFSVPQGVDLPPSLKNIFKEARVDPGSTSRGGDLGGWAQQGVFLLNTLLTVKEQTPMAHKAFGWERFTDRVIEILNQKREGVVFMLWGNHAKAKGKKVDRKRHCVLEGAHPSPLSCTKFFGCNHFNLANDYLEEKGKQPIDWRRL
uniref:Uracil-DNA glycosylase n=1 Tax=Chromera velia CCMP2878 TaxID=1169474 RepID=A0A0G4HYJ7_9ALVE|eukprot:Cvel_1542.t1-p1 / transcript=Cvel_1542.t1 / gene=Cvel_1542 / organism=Chromera_velia_CCMP2878 / gene_product=Uracil-DNA glycosylase, putative / transcript_product=Uracil-DNA glycosylase, putative / location=Cvel_scaffold54:96023-101926(-) / protein_length=360 / sequence_SO=supercontig / SO=protein_coding / is_pseudo=false